MSYFGYKCGTFYNDYIDYKSVPSCHILALFAQHYIVNISKACSFMKLI